MTVMNNLSSYQHIQPVDQRCQLSIDVFSPMRCWLNQLEIHNVMLARFICRLIPAQCPFARTISWKGSTVIVIPPLCKLNPLYEELIGLRFRALCYLADQCREDIYATVPAGKF